MKTTGKPNGRPRKLTSEQAQAVCTEIEATPVKRRCFVMMRQAAELRVGVSTIQRYLTNYRRERFAQIMRMFHKEPQNPPRNILPSCEALPSIGPS